MYNKFLAILLCFMILFCSTAPVYASSMTATATMISEAEWLSNGSALLSEALTKYGRMGAVAATNASIVVGSAVFAYAGTKGIEFAVDATLDTSATLGRWLISNIADLDDEVQRYIASTILNCSASADYYETRNNIYSSRLMHGLDAYLGNYIDSNYITMNQGLVSQNVIDADVLNMWTVSLYEVYEKMANPVFIDMGSSAIYRYWVYEAPPLATHVLLNTNGTSAMFYSSSGELLSISGLATIYFSESQNQWYLSKSGQVGLALSNGYEVDYGGLTVMQGSSFAGAMGLTTTFPLGLSYDKKLEVPWVLTDDMVVPYSTAIDVGTGTTAIEDVASVEAGQVDNSGLLNDIIDWLSGILNAIKSLARDIADAIGDMLKAFFIPSDASIEMVRNKLDEKLPLVGDLRDWSDNVSNVIGNPEDYASTLEFTVDMSKAEDTIWDYGDSKTNMIKMDWYFKYKEQVDSIIIGIAWLIFLWNLYGQLPNIISAVGSGVYLEMRPDSRKRGE